MYVFSTVWKQTVPAWEKQFCKVIGSMDWETFLHLKKYVNMYDNVMKWDDSAGEEAFSIAKKRFWAQMHGYSCDHLPLPDPDLCIDQLIHPELIADLEAEPVEEDHDPVVIFGDALYADHPLPPMGWGDEDEFPVPVEYGFENAPADYGAPWDQTGGNSGNESGRDDDWGYWNYGGAGL